MPSKYGNGWCMHDWVVAWERSTGACRPCPENLKPLFVLLGTLGRHGAGTVRVRLSVRRVTSYLDCTHMVLSGHTWKWKCTYRDHWHELKKIVVGFSWEATVGNWCAAINWWAPTNKLLVASHIIVCLPRCCLHGRCTGWKSSNLAASYRKKEL
jgi:hypothetical protein